MDSLIIDSRTSRDYLPDNQIKIKLTGILELIVRPCQSLPCSNKKVYAIHNGHDHYIISVDRKWVESDELLIWKDIILNIGETLYLEGVINDFCDINNDSYCEILVTSVVSR